MRERHNITGTEVGRPRPPFYMTTDVRLRTRRPRVLRLWVLATLTLGGVCFAVAALL